MVLPGRRRSAGRLRETSRRDAARTSGVPGVCGNVARGIAWAPDFAERSPTWPCSRSRSPSGSRSSKSRREELGAKYALVVFPRSYQYSDRESPRSWEAGEYEPLGEYVLEPFRYLDEIRGGFDFPVYSLLPDFQNTNVYPTCFPNDPHWNPAGARLAAGSIHRQLHRGGQLEPVGGAGSQGSPR